MNISIPFLTAKKACDSQGGATKNSWGGLDQLCPFRWRDMAWRRRGWVARNLRLGKLKN